MLIPPSSSLPQSTLDLHPCRFQHHHQTEIKINYTIVTIKIIIALATLQHHQRKCPHHLSTLKGGSPTWTRTHLRSSWFVFFKDHLLLLVLFMKDSCAELCQNMMMSITSLTQVRWSGETYSLLSSLSRGQANNNPRIVFDTHFIVVKNKI